MQTVQFIFSWDGSHFRIFSAANFIFKNVCTYSNPPMAQKDTVSKQSQHYEVNWWPHAILDPALWANPIIHHLVPVLACQDLQENHAQHVASVVIWFVWLKWTFARNHLRICCAKSGNSICNYSICRSKQRFRSCWLCSRAEADLFTFQLSDIHAHICVRGCVGW